VGTVFMLYLPPQAWEIPRLVLFLTKLKSKTLLTNAPASAILFYNHYMLIIIIKFILVDGG